MTRKTSLHTSLYLLFALLLLATCATQSRADVVTVHVFCCNFSINPSGQTVVQPTITAGDTIHWVWDEAAPSHSVTSISGSSEVFDSGLQALGFTFDHTFMVPGTYKYYCTLHGIDNHDGTASGMWGSVKVLPAVQVSALTVSPTTLPGPKAAVGAVTLSAAAPAGGFAVTLSSSNSAATVPSSIMIPAGATTGKFTIKTKTVTVTTKSTITATGGGVSISKVLMVKPIGVKAIVLGPDAVQGGDSAMGAVVLEAPAPAGGITVTLTSSTLLAGVPASISIPSGALAGTFTITTTATTTSGTSTIKASANGVAKSATLTVLP